MAINLTDGQDLRTLLSAASLFVLIVGGGAAFQAVRSGLEEQQRTTARLEQLIAAQNVGATAREARISALELSAGRTDERLVSILAILSRIERQLEGQP
tara:strand:- start:7536 stop:7832 length:297 start_codon:yes stop_codon:yes gene_type:complete